MNLNHRENVPGGIGQSESRLAHIAFIMGGNGRWAQKRGMPREYGHVQGAKTMFDIATLVFKRQIPCMTIYAFSTENWSRPQKEIEALTSLLHEYIKKARRIMEEDNVRFRFIGDYSRFGDKVAAMIEDLVRDSAGNRWMLNTALNYGGRDEIVRAANKALAEGKTMLTEEDISRHLDTAPCPPLDLIVRTAGEMRLSNFLLWQAAYAEFYATPALWPDFDEAELEKAIAAFSQRKRRFGGLVNK